MTTNQPAKRFRLGSITVTIWANTDRNGRAFHTTSFHRSYRDAKGVWANTTSLRAVDLPVVRVLAQQAQEWLLAHEAALVATPPSALDPVLVESHQYHR